MPKKKSLVSEDLLAARADDLIPVVVALDLPDTGPLWAAIRRSWSAEDLDGAVAGFRDAGDLATFRAVLVAKTMLPMRWWHSLENTMAAVRKYEEDFGEFPTATGLKKHGMWSLLDAIVKIHGGFDAVRGTTRVRAAELFPDFASVAAAIRKKEAELGRTPTGREALKIPGLSAVLNQYGNYVAVCQKMGVTLSERQTRSTYVNADGIARRRPPSPETASRGTVFGPHRNTGRPREKSLWPRIETEMLAIARKIGHVPSAPELRAMGRSDLSNSIQAYHGGMKAVRPRLEAVLAAGD